MKILLDTHIFLWFISNDKRLSPQLAEHISEPENDVYLSVVSIWEASVKHQLGKLPLPESPAFYLPIQREKHGFITLPLAEADVTQLRHLPAIHRDPFDRMLICQTLQHGLIIATEDDIFRNYPVNCL